MRGSLAFFPPHRHVAVFARRYMRGRVTHGQLNAVVQGINAAVTGKYSILQQSAKALSSALHKLHQRFKDEETKDTKGICSILSTACLIVDLAGPSVIIGLT